MHIAHTLVAMVDPLIYSAVQSQKAISAYLTSEQTLPFGFAEKYCYMLISLNSRVMRPVSSYLIRINPVNAKHLYNIFTMLDQRRRRWSNIVQMLYKCFVFAGNHVE